jgi:MFS family permease
MTAAPPSSEPLPTAAVARHPLAPAYSEWADPRFRRLLLLQMGYGYAFSALLITPKYATAALHASPDEVGTLMACAGVAIAVTSPLLGRWLDGGGARAAMLWGSLVLGVSTLLFASVTELGLAIYGLRALHGVASALITSATGAYVAAIVPADRHGRAFASAGAAALMMNAIAPAVTEHLAEAYGWRTAFELAATIALTGGAFGTTLPTLEGAPLSVRDPRAPRAKGPLVSAVSTGAFAAGMGFGVISTFTQPYALALGGRHVSSLFLGYTITVLIVRVGLGGVVDRFGRLQCAVAALVIYTLTTAWASALTPDGLFALGLGFGAAHGLVWPSLSALTVERAPRGHAASALARLYGSFSLGGLTAVWAGGWLVKGTGYPLTFLIAAGAIGIGTGVLFASRSKHARSEA